MFHFALILSLYAGTHYDPIERAFSDAGASQVARQELRKVCRRESHCNPAVSVHSSDGRHGRDMFEAAVSRGYLDRSCLVQYLDVPSHEWAPRGLYGMAPAYHLKRVSRPGQCLHPAVFDDPYIATLAAVSYFRAMRHRTCTERLVRWAGPGIWRTRSLWHRLDRVGRTCGFQAMVTYAFFG